MSQTWNGTKKETPERRTYTVDDIAQILGIGRTSAYILVKEGHFKIVRIGNAIRISKRSFDEIRACQPMSFFLYKCKSVLTVLTELQRLRLFRRVDLLL